MIAIESVKRFRFKDLKALIFFGVVWLGLVFLTDKFFTEYNYMISLLIITTLLAFVVHLVRKAGTATLFMILGAALTFFIPDLGITGASKVLVFGIAGAIFEISFLILKLEFNNLQIDVIVGTALAATSLPLITAIILSINSAFALSLGFTNLLLLSFFIGLAGATLAFILWMILRNTKYVMRFEYEY